MRDLGIHLCFPTNRKREPQPNRRVIIMGHMSVCKCTKAHLSAAATDPNLDTRDLSTGTGMSDGTE